MAFDGSGTFNRIYNWINDRIAGIPITDSRMEGEFDGIATGLSNTVTKDGQTTTTAMIPFALGIKVGDGTAGSPAVTFSSDTDTGLFRKGANNLGVAVGGAEVADISSTALTVDVPVLASNIRNRLTASKDYYVRTDGNDSNTGLANTAGAAFLTIQNACNVVARTIDPAQQSVTIHVADGTYSENITLPPVPGAPNNGGISISGNTTTPNNVIIAGNSAVAAIFALGDGNDWLVEGVKVTNASGAGVYGHAGAWIRLNKVNIGACVIQIQADHLGTVEIQGNMTLSGNCSYGFVTNSGGYLLVTAITITVSGTPAYSARFTYAGQDSLQVWSATISGSATGQRFSASGGHIFSADGTATYFPGNAVGAKDTGGTYDGKFGVVTIDDSLAVQHVVTSGTAPSITAGFTGTGSGGTITLVTGSNDNAGRILITAGSGASASGSFVLNFSAALGSNAAVVSVTACGNTGVWTTPNISITSQSTTTATIAWINGVTLVNGSAYIVNYVALGT